MRIIDKACVISKYYGPRVDSATNSNENQQSSWGVKGRPAHKAGSLTATCEPTA
jgi:hypothetical protein